MILADSIIDTCLPFLKKARKLKLEADKHEKLVKLTREQLKTANEMYRNCKSFPAKDPCHDEAFELLKESARELDRHLKLVKHFKKGSAEFIRIFKDCMMNHDAYKDSIYV